MEDPGLSLFQGPDGIQLNTSSQRQEEEEEQDEIDRRNELQNMVECEFEDLDDDFDASSVNSSHYQDTGHVDHSDINSSLHPNEAEKIQTSSEFRRDFRVFNHVEETNNCDQSTLSIHRLDSNSGPTVSDIQRDFNVHSQIAVSCNKSDRIGNIAGSASESLYDLPKPPMLERGHSFRRPVSDEYSFNHGYPDNYDTPANHYDRRINSYPNNGYIDRYGSSVLDKVQELGAGDNESNDHINRYNKPGLNGRSVNDSTAYKMTEYQSKEQIEVLYSIRMREIEKLTDQLDQLRLEKKEEKSQLDRKLALAQAEIERTKLSRNQAQNALVDARAEITELHTQMAALKEKIAVLEKTNKNMSEDLSVARGSVTDLQHKVAVLEGIQSLQANDKTHEKFLKQAQEKHTVEVRNMQTQIDVLTDKLNTKESSYVALENKLADVRRAHETLMVEKGDTMNRLAEALEKSQAQYRNLMASNNAQEIMQLQTQVKLATQEKEELLKTVQELHHKLELAKSDITQYDSLLGTTCEEESDSIRQMKLGEAFHKSKCKSSEDITQKLKGELQRCLAGQALKRKEINRLENTLAQKEEELEKALKLAETCREEAARQAKRVNELEHELKSLLTDKAMKANIQIQKLSDHLQDVKKQYENMKEEKESVEQRLKQALAANEETLKQLHKETLEQQQQEAVAEYNKEYLEIHDKAIERVRQEAEVEIVQLSVQLQETQKQLDSVKEMYVDVCRTKEQLIAEHKKEIKALKETYFNLEGRKQEMEKMAIDLSTQIKVTERLSKECENYRSKVNELEKELSQEKKKRDEYTKKIHTEIERAKESALQELRNAYPNQHINIHLPDAHCSEHLDKITQLEDDCRRLEEKLSVAVEEQRKMSDLQTELDDTRLKIAQMEIAYESLKKKYENIVIERDSLSSRISQLEDEQRNARKNSKKEDSDDAKLKIAEMQLENKALRGTYDVLLRDRNACKEKISKLETELAEAKQTVSSLESRLRKYSESSLTSRSEVDKELCQYKDTVVQLTSKLNSLKDSRKGDFILEQRIKQLEKDLQDRDDKLQRLKGFENIKEERDQLVMKLKNQAKQFEQYINSQRQVSAELNLSPRSGGDGTDFQKLKEMTIKEVREGMEQRVAEELRAIEEQHREKRLEIEEKYKSLLMELQAKCNDKTKEVEAMKEALLSEKVKLHSSFKAQEQMTQMTEARLQMFHQELISKQLRIEELQVALRQKENEVEEEKNVMTQVISEWTSEIKEIQTKEGEMKDEIRRLKEAEERLTKEIDELHEQESQMKNSIASLKDKYQSAKKIANNYKKYAESKEQFLTSEYKRIKEGYERAMIEVQQKAEAILSTNEKLTELESQYEQRLEQMRLKLKYKNKC
ncbi:golgin subfamily B member 1 [Orussus abietinus]|uniref:golgin subfamily B member 1 n=1 Tax=Orussus abietinus TaxID=222816 RepID=UPI000625783D|nr:golgin subfamily B member 1 [Orussus abietinus]